MTTNVLLQRGSGTDCPHYYKDVKRWDSISGFNPKPLSDIVLPDNTRVILSGCMLEAGKVYSRIRIPRTSELIIDDQPMDWNVGHLIVEGRLRIGSDTCRTQNQSAHPFPAVFLASRLAGSPSPGGLARPSLCNSAVWCIAERESAASCIYETGLIMLINTDL